MAGPKHTPSAKDRSMVAGLPRRGKGVLVVSEMGWWEAHGNLVVACVKHKRGEDDEQLNAKLPRGFKGLIGHSSLKGHGDLRMVDGLSRGLCDERLDLLVEKFGTIIDKHPLLWLHDVAEAMGVDEWTALETLTGQ